MLNVFLFLDLSRHYGLTHRVVFNLMRAELGDDWKVGDGDVDVRDTECHICRQVTLGRRLIQGRLDTP